MHEHDQKERVDSQSRKVLTDRLYGKRPMRKQIADGYYPYRKPYTPGRNSPCPCNSGLKFKRCHGRRLDGES